MDEGKTCVTGIEAQRLGKTCGIVNLGMMTTAERARVPGESLTLKQPGVVWTGRAV